MSAAVVTSRRASATALEIRTSSPPSFGRSGTAVVTPMSRRALADDAMCVSLREIEGRGIEQMPPLQQDDGKFAKPGWKWEKERLYDFSIILQLVERSEKELPVSPTNSKSSISCSKSTKVAIASDMFGKEDDLGDNNSLLDASLKTWLMFFQQRQFRKIMGAFHDLVMEMDRDDLLDLCDWDADAKKRLTDIAEALHPAPEEAWA